MSRAAALCAILAAGCLPQVGPPVGADGAAGGGGGSAGGSGGGTAAASCTNDQRDGTETDVDCGGVCPGCTVGGACAMPTDCAGGLCSPQGRCVAAADPCPLAFAGCTTFAEATDGGAPVVIRFPVGGLKYSPACVRVRFGQSVTFEGGDLADHPLKQACGPVRNFVSANGGTRVTLVMDRALGTFGFFCAMHGAASGTGMAGAIEVVR